jgi:hypothetical protein
MAVFDLPAAAIDSFEIASPIDADCFTIPSFDIGSNSLG